MDSKNLKEEGIYDCKFIVQRRPGRPRKIQSHNFKAEEMVNSSNEKEVPYSDDLPEFFKIYMPALCSTMLRIPPDFIEKFGENIPTTCTLQRPWGGSWQVSVNRMNDRWFLEKGWPRFVEQNSIRDLDFLTFCYVGKSVFLVKIFSPNGCTKGAGRTSKIDDETSESESSEEEIDESKRRRGRVLRCRGSSIAENFKEEINGSKRRRGRVSRCRGSSIAENSEEINESKRRRGRVSRCRESSIAENFEETNESKRRSGRVSRCRGSSIAENSEEINESKRRRGRVSRCRGRSIAENSAEEINESKLGKVSRWGSWVGEIDGKPCFSIKMLKTCFKGGQMCVPSEFWNAHLREHTTSKIATLWVGNDSWSVEFVIIPGRVLLRRGCLKFLADNSLKIGNLCTFQLIDSNDLSFKVMFHRA